MKKTSHKDSIKEYAKMYFVIFICAGIPALIFKSIIVFAFLFILLLGIIFTFAIYYSELIIWLVNISSKKNFDHSKFGQATRDYRNICIVHTKEKFNDLVDILEEDENKHFILGKNINKRCFIVTSDFFPKVIFWDTKVFDDDFDL